MRLASYFCTLCLSVSALFLLPGSVVAQEDIGVGRDGSLFIRAP